MFIRVVSGIKTHFPERFVEWVTAASCMWWGWTLAQPGTAWVNEAAWAGMLRLAPEDTWGAISMMAGGFWIVALAINGTFADTIYAKHSPKVRGIAAVGSSFVWFQVVLSVSAVQTSGSGIYPLPLALSLWCIFNAWRDIGQAHAGDRRA